MAINSGKAQVVVYRPSAFGYGGISGHVEINGMAKCDLKVDGFMIANIQSGQTVIAVDNWQLPGTSKLVFNAKAGQKYYVKVSPNGDKVMAGAFAGYLGTFASEAASEQKGPFVIQAVNAGEANGALRSYKDSCHG